MDQKYEQSPICYAVAALNNLNGHHLLCRFFAMVKSHLVRMFDNEKATIGKDVFAGINKDELCGMIKDNGQGYNPYIFKRRKILVDFCKND